MYTCMCTYRKPKPFYCAMQNLYIYKNYVLFIRAHKQVQNVCLSVGFCILYVFTFKINFILHFQSLF